MGTHVLYNVTAVTNVAGYDSGNLNVKRRYSDFVALYAVGGVVLLLSWCGCSVA